MKRYIILIFALLALCFMDWSCGNKCGDMKSHEYNVSGLDTVRLSVKDSASVTTYYSLGDTVNYQKLQFSILRNLELVQNELFSFGTAAWAECVAPIDVVHWNIDSIRIWEIQGNDSIRVENSFGLLPSNYSHKNMDTMIVSNTEQFLAYFKDETSYQSNPSFVLVKGPSKQKKVAFRFQFYDASGQIFDAVTEQINIAP